MTELRGLYTLWLREIKRFLRDRTRLISMFIQPLLWLVIFGAGFGLHFALPGLTYQQVIFPGIVGQAARRCCGYAERQEDRTRWD